METYDAGWDKPHEPGPDVDWQESDWLGGAIVLTLDSGEVIRLETLFLQALEGGLRPGVRFGGTGTISYRGQVELSQCAHGGDLTRGCFTL